MDYGAAIFYGLTLDGIGLVILGRKAAWRAALWQGFLEWAVATFGFAIELFNLGEPYGLVWLISVLAIGLGRYHLHRCLAKQHGGIRSIKSASIKLPTDDAASEGMLFLLMAMAVTILGLRERCSMPMLGAISWSVVFGTAAASYASIGGIGLISLGLALPIRVVLRGTTLCGVAGLAYGCWHRIF